MSAARGAGQAEVRGPTPTWDCSPLPLDTHGPIAARNANGMITSKNSMGT